MRASEVRTTARDVPRGRGAATRDESTRLLCAAAHRDVWFADVIVRSYLVEEVGAVPPSPGLDAAAVLRDAVAAQTRRFIRDVLVLLLLALLFVLAPAAVVVWLVVVVLAGRKVKPALLAHGRAMGVVGALALLAAIGAVQALPFTHLPYPPGWWPAVAVAGLIFLILAAERFAGDVYLRSRFQPTTFVADPGVADSAVERLLRTFGTRRFAAQLTRVAEADEYHASGREKVDVIVHRTTTPFVGAGYPVRTEPVTVAAKGRKAKPIDIADLHRHLAKKLLAEHAEIGELLHRRQVVVAADQLVRLVRAQDTPLANTIFDLKRPPERHLPATAIGEVVDDEVEGVRFYSCFRTESFSRRAVVSCYLRVTAKMGLIQLRLTPCVLPPVDPWFEEVNRTAGYGWLNKAALDLLTLPPSGHRRLWGVLRRARPRTPWSSKKVEPERYGASISLRERASPGVAKEHWYQNDDASGTMAILSKRIFDEVATYLRKCGYDVSQLRKDATSVVNSYSVKISGGQFNDVDIAGNIFKGRGKDKSADDSDKDSEPAKK